MEEAFLFMFLPINLNPLESAGRYENKFIYIQYFESCPFFCIKLIIKWEKKNNITFVWFL